MINVLFNGMLTVMLAHFALNEIPHALEYSEKRGELVDKYGTWSVGRAEAVCPKHDVECVERESARLLGAYRRSFVE